MQPERQLLAAFSAAGFQDDLKKNLRAAIIHKLQATQQPTNHNTHDALSSRLLASLIAQELALAEHTYTLAIYAVESTYQDGLLSRKELTEMLNIQGKQSNISVLKMILSKYYPFCEGDTAYLRNTHTQTMSQEEGCGFLTLQEKLSLVDHTYERINQPTRNNQQKPVTKTRQELQEVYRIEKDRDMKRYKQFQLQGLKLQLGEEWRTKFNKFSEHMQSEFRRKYDALRTKQKALNEEYILKNKILEQKISQAEKTLTQKASLLEMKGMTIQTQLSNLRHTQQNVKNELKIKSDELFEKRQQYDSLLINLQKKIDYEVNLCKLSTQQEHHEKQKQFLERRKFVDEQHSKIMTLMNTAELIRKDNDRLNTQNTYLRTDLQEAQQQVKKYLAEVLSRSEKLQSLKEQIRGVKDERGKVGESLNAESQKRKRMEGEVLAMRKELDKHRAKEEEEEQSSKQDQSQKQANSQISDLNLKLEVLRQNRKRDIDQFKRDL